jgi:hypothetical protein
MDTDRTAATAAPATAIVVIEPENLSRMMMVSFALRRLAATESLDISREIQTFVHGSHPQPQFKVAERS